MKTRHILIIRTLQPIVFHWLPTRVGFIAPPPPSPHYWLCEFLQHFHVILMGLIQFHAAITSVFRTDNSRDKIQIWLALRGCWGSVIGSNESCGAVSSSVSMRSKNMECRLCIYSICWIFVLCMLNIHSIFQIFVLYFKCLFHILNILFYISNIYSQFEIFVQYPKNLLNFKYLIFVLC